MAPCLLDKPGKQFFEYSSPSVSPTTLFHSEYLGQTVHSLKSTFLAMVPEKDNGTHALSVFLVLDEWTLEDETVWSFSVSSEDIQMLRADLGCQSWL